MLLFRRTPALAVLLVHPGGPFWARKDLGAWSIPKGEYAAGEEAIEAAQREFHEETGFTAHGPFLSLGQVKQAGGKIVTAWAAEGDADPAELRSNMVTLAWPPRSGRSIRIPEADRAAWFTIAEARARINPGQQPFLDRLLETLDSGG